MNNSISKHNSSVPNRSAEQHNGPAGDYLLETASRHFGIDYLFPYQRLAVTNILEAENFSTPGDPGDPGDLDDPGDPGDPDDQDDARDAKPHQIIILPTGAGKSLCFMLPSLLLSGVTMVIFPLLGLISDQARRCEEADIPYGVLRGGQSNQEREQVWEALTRNRLRILLTNPETALSPRVLEKLKMVNLSLLVVDEMHTVSEWGDTFRPVYLELGRLVEEARIPLVTAFTATASDHILKRVREIIFPHSSPHLIRADPDRPNITYRVIPSICKDHDLVRLLSKDSVGVPHSSQRTSSPADESQSRTSNPQAVERPAIVFCRSRVAAEMTARMLRCRLKEDEIYFYHAGLERDEKTGVEEWFYHSNDGILCTTCAYGMGVDKKNVRTVIHRSPSPSVEAYLQESGRGGRDREPAKAVLLYSDEDKQRLLRIDDRYSRERFAGMLAYAEDTLTCRREKLLQMLSAEPEACFGCDVCGGTVQQSPVGKSEIIHFARKNKRRYVLREARHILRGRKTFEVMEKHLYLTKGFGYLPDWSEEEIETGINELRRAGIIRIPRRGPWKHRITVGKK